MVTIWYLFINNITYGIFTLQWLQKSLFISIFYIFEIQIKGLKLNVINLQPNNNCDIARSRINMYTQDQIIVLQQFYKHKYTFVLKIIFLDS